MKFNLVVQRAFQTRDRRIKRFTEKFYSSKQLGFDYQVRFLEMFQKMVMIFGKENLKDNIQTFQNLARGSLKNYAIKKIIKNPRMIVEIDNVPDVFSHPDIPQLLYLTPN